MSKALAKVNARLIYKGVKTIDDIPEKDRDIVRVTYRELFGEDI